MDTGVVSGIRTHEANATDLKSVPFDHSGITTMVHEVGFEPTKLMQQILSLSPLTAREFVQIY